MSGTAFVLSSGGNRGALEIGALLALLEHGLTPDILVGCSVGALNATGMAVNPSLEGAQNIAQLWMRAQREEVFRGNYLSMARRLLAGRNSLFPNRYLKRFVENHLPLGFRCFADLKEVALYIVAADLNTGRLHVFGEDPSDSLVDAIMASCAAIPYFPPWNYRGHQYIDGGALSALPLGVALEKGATEIYAIDVNYIEEVKEPIRGWLNILSRVASMVAYQQFLNDLKWTQYLGLARVHHIPMKYHRRLHLWDLSYSAEMIEVGRKAAENFLSRSESPE